MQAQTVPVLELRIVYELPFLRLYGFPYAGRLLLDGTASAFQAIPRFWRSGFARGSENAGLEHQAGEGNRSPHRKRKEPIGYPAGAESEITHFLVLLWGRSSSGGRGWGSLWVTKGKACSGAG